MTRCSNRLAKFVLPAPDSGIIIQCLPRNPVPVWQLSHDAVLGFIC